MTYGRPTEEGKYFIRLRDELEAELRDCPEVETVALGKKDGKKALVVLVRNSAPQHLRTKWQTSDRTFKGVQVVAREWGSAHIPRPPGANIG